MTQAKTNLLKHQSCQMEIGAPLDGLGLSLGN
jgi:hypothetical protein